MLCLENYSLLAACQSVPEWSDSTAVGRKFKLERTTCLVLCSSGVNKVASLFPLRAPLCLDGILPLAEKTWHIPRAPGVNTLPNHNSNLPGFNLQRWCLLSSSLQNDAKQKANSQELLSPGWGVSPCVWGKGLPSQSELETQRESSIIKAISKERDPETHFSAKDFNNQKYVVVHKAMTPTPACQMGSRGRRGKKHKNTQRT